MTALASMAAEETYHDFHKDIHGIVWTFHREHGGEIDELLGEAHLHYVNARESYQRECGPFHFWIKANIRWGLLMTARKIHRERVRRQNMEIELVAHKRVFRLKSLLTELSEDARAVALLALDPPLPIRISTALDSGEDRHKRIRQSLYEFLSDAGWCRDRIWDSFHEIREALVAH